MRLRAPGYLFLTLNVWLCLTAVLMVVVTARSLSVPASAVGVGLLLPPLLTYVVYVEDRRRVRAEDDRNQPDRTRLVRRYGRQLLATELAAFVGYQSLLVALVRTGPRAGVGAFLLGQVPFIVLAAYDRLKRYPPADSLSVACTWAFVVVFAVFVSADVAVSADVVAVFCAWVLIVFAGVESRNVPDADGDTSADRQTLAGRLGRRNTTVLEILLKGSGLLVFWSRAGAFVAGLVVVYLLALRAFRALTVRAMVRDRPDAPV
ncbi:MAG: UbiA family prenyltransferase [Haloarculaceae archaeon]